MSMQVLPTAPSPTVTHFMNLDALILFRPPSRYGGASRGEREREREREAFVVVLPPPPPGRLDGEEEEEGEMVERERGGERVV